MQKNVGTVDKTIRIVVGVALLSLIFVLDGGVRWLGLLGLVLIITALSGWCPGYAVLGVNSCDKKHGSSA